MKERIEQLEQFCRLIKARTEEHRQAVNVLLDAGHYSVAFGILRQEIDSLIKVSYLNDISQNNSPTRARKFIRDTIQGMRWTNTTSKGKQVPITDREMLEAYRHAIGWEKIVYAFGCELIHLSRLHDYESVDPISTLSENSKEEITAYLKQYHGFNEQFLTFDAIILYLPKVISKICDNTLYITKELEDRLREQLT